MVIIGADDIPVRNALLGLWKPVSAKEKVITDTVTAEMLKYAFNTFFATKVVWANAMYDACETNGADYKVIREALMAHLWGSKYHLKAVHKGGRGAGGRCLPKDVNVFAKYSNSEFLKTVNRINKQLLIKSQKE